MGEGKRLLKNSGIVAIAGFSTKLITFLLLPIYTAVLSTSEYGDYDYALTILFFALPVATLLMDEAMFRFLIDCNTQNEKTKVFTTAACIEVLGIIFFLILFLVITLLLQYKYAVWVTGFILTDSIKYIINPLLRGQGKYKLFAINNIIISFSISAISVALVLLTDMGIYGLLTGAIIGNAIGPIIISIYIKVWNFLDFSVFSKDEAKVFIKYALPLIPNKLSWTIISLADRIVTMNFLGSSMAGIFAVSNKFPQIMDAVYGFFVTAWQETASRVVNKEPMVFYNTMYQYMQRFVLSMSCMLCAMMPILFPILINESFQDAYKYVPLLLFAVIFSEMSAFYGGIFYAYKDTVTIGISTVIAAILKVILLIVLIKIWGLYGAAFSSIISNILLCVYRKVALKKYVNIKEDWLIFVSFLLCYCINSALIMSNSIMLFVINLTLSTCYSVFINRKLILWLLNTFKGNKKNKINM